MSRRVRLVHWQRIDISVGRAVPPASPKTPCRGRHEVRQFAYRDENVRPRIALRWACHGLPSYLTAKLPSFHRSRATVQIITSGRRENHPYNYVFSKILRHLPRGRLLMQIQVLTSSHVPENATISAGRHPDSHLSPIADSFRSTRSPRSTAHRRLCSRYHRHCSRQEQPDLVRRTVPHTKRSPENR